MKLSTIAKTSLALGILTTGVMTTHAQSVHAAETSVQIENISDDVKELYNYYKKSFFEYKNVNGTRRGNIVEIPYGVQLTNVSLLGNDKNTIKEGFSSGIDVFVVREDNGKAADNNSIGGITETNKGRYHDWLVDPRITLTKNNGGAISQSPFGRLPLTKEKVSLKELDFKLRKKLMDANLLYTNGKKNGTIVVKMYGAETEKYTFELDKKLQDHRMGDVIDSRKIEKITVEL
ncbi:superantigen-like protein [Staphylococcus hyicus]|uniref:exotoxin beta-grasp domain-containing protein n=1 Tax=Staphylococcus hyicus TaxID=1284 RepID=UPI00208E5C1C|nr:superantigen-like protein [Staphylococcus hyicus]MCO4329715.1 superantigen-like protein [Staphylococcus hyicus]MCO4337294.1 superantigen-like protein [Staphylococcus hyicus]